MAVFRLPLLREQRRPKAALGSLRRVMNNRLALFALAIFSLAVAKAAPPAPSCDATAVAALEEKAGQGDYRAQYWLGVQLEQGLCGTRDRGRANSLLQQSAARDFPPAVHVLGVILRRDGKDEEAITYFERSAKLGFQAGFADMGFTYGQRDSRVRNAVLSYAWLTLAISREPKADLRGYLENSRAKVEKAMSDADLTTARGIAEDLKDKFSQVPVWSDKQ
jgi:TPR repeat protein